MTRGNVAKTKGHLHRRHCPTKPQQPPSPSSTPFSSIKECAKHNEQPRCMHPQNARARQAPQIATSARQAGTADARPPAVQRGWCRAPRRRRRSAAVPAAATVAVTAAATAPPPPPMRRHSRCEKGWGMEGRGGRGCGLHRPHRRRRDARGRVAAARRATGRRARRHRRARCRRCAARVRLRPLLWRGRGRPATHGGDTLRAASAAASAAAPPAAPSPASDHPSAAAAAAAPATGGRSRAPSSARPCQTTRRRHG